MPSSLEEQILERRRDIATDAYAMSIGELVNLYQEGELDIHPEFQRVYRWDDEQKSKLIESILLGIPLPSIFVAQREDGIWDIVDGVQRLSTIFHFMGVLKDDKGNLEEPLVLQTAPYLDLLAGTTYDGDPSPGSIPLSSAQRLDFKRAKMDVKIIKRESDPRAKFDLFQRLNTFGSPLTRQEARNCMLVSLDLSAFEWLEDLAENREFRTTINLPERAFDEQYHHELALRWLALRELDEQRIRSIRSLHDFMDEYVVELGHLNSSELASKKRVFDETFSLLSQALGDESFRKFNTDKGTFEGPFSLTAFEVIGMGLGAETTDRSSITPDQVATIVKETVWQDEQIRRPGFATGLSSDQRLKKTVPLGRAIFADA